MNERMVRFERPGGVYVLIPVGGHTWTNGTYSFDLVDSGYPGRTRWAMYNNGRVRYASSEAKIMIECKNEAWLMDWLAKRDASHT